jgi:hypothetical protein
MGYQSLAASFMLAFSHTLKMDAIFFSDTAVDFPRYTRHCIPIDRPLRYMILFRTIAIMHEYNPLKLLCTLNRFCSNSDQRGIMKVSIAVIIVLRE